MTTSIVGAIAPHLQRAEIERASHKPTASLGAHDYFLQAMAQMHRGTREAIDQALALFSKAIELAANYATAYGMAAWCYFWRKVNGWLVDRPREIAEGTRLASVCRPSRRSLIVGHQGPPEPAELSDVVAVMAASHALAGRIDDARRAVEQFRQLDPRLRASNLTEWLPIRQPQHLAIFSDGFRRAGLPD